MKRRTAIRIVALSALAAKLDAVDVHGGHPSLTTVWSANQYQLRFFTAAENELLDQLTEMIIPADDHSPGAHAARVSLFADLMVATSSESIQKHWREGLKLMHEEGAKSSLSEALAKSTAHEGHPVTPLERFFATLKRMTINGYYTSEIGIHRDLQYQGNTYLDAFPGCTIEKISKADGGKR